MLNANILKWLSKILIILCVIFTLPFYELYATEQSSADSSSAKWVIDKITSVTGANNSTMRYFYDENGNNIKVETVSYYSGVRQECTMLMSYDTNFFMIKSIQTCSSGDKILSTGTSEHTNNSEGKPIKIFNVQNNNGHSNSTTILNEYDSLSSNI